LSGCAAKGAIVSFGEVDVLGMKIRVGNWNSTHMCFMQIQSISIKYW